MQFKFIIYFFLLSFITACLNKTQIKLPEADNTNSAVEQLNWNYPNPTVLSGEMIPFSFSNGVPLYVTDSQGIGVFNSLTLEYTPPLNNAPASHSISAVDSAGKIGSNNIKIAGFQAGSRISFPLTFGGQNIPTSSVSTLNGDIFVSARASNATGWEIWAIYKSSDFGVTWSRTDTYAPYFEGEAHPLALTAKGNDVYACGYQWELSGAYNTVWNVRKSSNGGTTWSNVDEYHDYLNGDHFCYDIAVDSNSGKIFAAGYDANALGWGGIVRSSVDDGNTWSTIGNFPNSSIITVKVSPAGVVWAIADDGSVYQGTYALGVWNWINAGTTVVSNFGINQLLGDLEIVSETTAYFSGNNNGWKISKTIDGGATWATVYDSGLAGTGQDIKRLSTGELVAAGYFDPAPTSFVILHSIDDGLTWTQTYSDNSEYKQGVTITQASDSSVLAFGNYGFLKSQIIALKSTNSGASWTQQTEIYFKTNYRTEFNDLKIDSMGNLWAVGNLELTDNTHNKTWAVIKSSDSGTTWQDSDVFTLPGNNSTAISLAIGPSNEIYAAGITSNARYSLRKSTDSGSSWIEIDNHTRASAVLDDVKIALANNGDVFYAGTKGWPYQVELRRGAANGTIWTSVITLPNWPNSNGYKLTGMAAFSDGSLWVAGIDYHSINGQQNVIYRSTDSGVTFTELLRENGNNSNQELKRLSNGDVYAISGETLKRTSNNGASWTMIYDGTASGISGYAIDAFGRLYVLDYNDSVLAQNQFNGNWFKAYDYSQLNTYIGMATHLTNCGNPSQVCLLTYHEDLIDGSIIQMYPLTIP